MANSIVLGNLYHLFILVFLMCYASYTMLSVLEQFKLREWKPKLLALFWMAVAYSFVLWLMHSFILHSMEKLVFNYQVFFVFMVKVILITIIFHTLLRTTWGRKKQILSALLIASSNLLLQYLHILAIDQTVIHFNMTMIVIAYIFGFIGSDIAIRGFKQPFFLYKLKSSLFMSVSIGLMYLFGVQGTANETVHIVTSRHIYESLLLILAFIALSIILILNFKHLFEHYNNKSAQMHEHYKLLVENSYDTLAFIKDGKWEYINPSGVRLFEARSEQELIGRSIYVLLEEAHHRELETLLATDQRDERKQDGPIELQWRTIQGKPISTEMILMPTHLSGNRIEQVIIRDISARKQKEELFIKSEKLTIAGQLAAGVAHEIRNPLTSLKGFLQLITTGRIHSKRYYSVMKSEIACIETVINGLLMLSKPQAYTCEPMDLRLLIKDSIGLLETQAAIQNVQIDYQSEHRPVWVTGVEAQLKQVFIHVLKNAMESMKNGGVVTIDLSVEDSNNVKVRIQDEGVGISKEQLDKIGQPFYTTKDEGTGLGLMVTYKIIDNHEGQIFAESEVGKGTTFTIRLPQRNTVAGMMILNKHA